MVRADEPRRVPARVPAELIAAVPARVDEPAQRAVVAADDEEGLVVDAVLLPVARPRAARPRGRRPARPASRSRPARARRTRARCSGRSRSASRSGRSRDRRDRGPNRPTPPVVPSSSDNPLRQRVRLRADVPFSRRRARRRHRRSGAAPASVPVEMPPSTGSTTPVTCAARSLARYSTASATSTVCPWCGSGCRPVTVALSKAALMSVAMFAGAMQFARMPCSPSSMASDRVKWTTRGLRGAVRQHPDAGADAGARGDVDDRAPAVIDHVASGAPAADHHPEHVDLHHAPEVAEVVVEEPAEAAGHARVVAHDVQSAEARHGEVHERLHLRGVGDVGAPEVPRAHRGRRRPARRCARRRRR